MKETPLSHSELFQVTPHQHLTLEIISNTISKLKMEKEIQFMLSSVFLKELLLTEKLVKSVEQSNNLVFILQVVKLPINQEIQLKDSLLLQLLMLNKPNCPTFNYKLELLINLIYKKLEKNNSQLTDNYLMPQLQSMLLKLNQLLRRLHSNNQKLNQLLPKHKLTKLLPMLLKLKLKDKELLKD